MRGVRKRGRRANGQWQRKGRRRTVPLRRGRRATIGELKFHDVGFSDAVIAATGAIIEDSVLTIAQGTTESTRIGRKVRVKSINWRFTLQLPTTATPAETADSIRIILYLDKQANGATATVTGILETAAFNAYRNLANTGRFVILMDRFYALNSQSGAGNPVGEQGINFGIHRKELSFNKTCDIPIEYDNSFTTGVISTMRSNNIGVLGITQAGLAGMTTSNMRIRFSDQ
ncbi:hypothetical protein [Gilliamella sp. CG33]|uniref:hypothetical protein n=1 Tax=Gilliamella sp. CG33 TaxID=3351506 RepID=UPI00398712E9